MFALRTYMYVKVHVHVHVGNEESGTIHLCTVCT